MNIVAPVVLLGLVVLAILAIYVINRVANKPFRYCPNCKRFCCHSEFCVYCGDKTVPELGCGCGEHYTPGHKKYCGKCGKKLE